MATAVDVYQQKHVKLGRVSRQRRETSCECSSVPKAAQFGCQNSPQVEHSYSYKPREQWMSAALGIFSNLGKIGWLESICTIVHSPL